MDRIRLPFPAYSSRQWGSVQTCRAGLPRMSEFKFSCTDFDGLGLDGLGLVFAYTKHVHCK
jgi:hypothetical protein